MDNSTVLGKFRINFPYVAAFEWPAAVEGRDLVMTNGYGIFVVIECKYIDKETTGKTAKRRRRYQRMMVKQQATDYRDLYQRLDPEAVVLMACSYTNEGLLLLDKDGVSFCQDGVAGSSSDVERSRLSPEYVVQLKSKAGAEEAVAEQKRIGKMQMLEKQILEYRQRLSDEQQRLDRLRGEIVHERLANERLRKLRAEHEEIGCCFHTAVVIGTTLGYILYLML